MGILAILISLHAAPAHTQEPSRLPPTIGVSGIVIEHSSNRPIQDAYVTATTQIDNRRFSATTDSMGVFQLRLPPGDYRLGGRCKRQFGVVARTLPERDVKFDVRDTAVTIEVPTAYCVDPPVKTETLTVTGHYTSGFEESHLMLCGPDTAVATMGRNHRIWLTWSLPKSVHLQWPEFPHTEYDPTVYLRARGRLSGPKSAGHLGLSGYEFKVDSVLELRRPSTNDCRNAPPLPFAMFESKTISPSSTR